MVTGLCVKQCSFQVGMGSCTLTLNRWGLDHSSPQILNPTVTTNSKEEELKSYSLPSVDRI